MTIDSPLAENDIWTVVVHFNNPQYAADTVTHLTGLGFTAARMVVYDNGSEATKRDIAQADSLAAGCGFLASKINHGWGGAINDFLRSRTWRDTDLLMIAAHDARIAKIDLADIHAAFEDPKCMFVSPRTHDDMEGFYGMARSFWYRKADDPATHEVSVGHATACIARPATLARLGFDEAYFIYGCESEVFLRAQDEGYKTLMVSSFVVDNPGTDSHSDFVVRAFAINSMYTAWKRHGLRGALVRAAALLSSAGKLWRAGQGRHGRVKIGAALYGLRHPHKGLRTYLDIDKRR